MTAPTRGSTGPAAPAPAASGRQRRRGPCCLARRGALITRQVSHLATRPPLLARSRSLRCDPCVRGHLRAPSGQPSRHRSGRRGLPRLRVVARPVNSDRRFTALPLGLVVPGASLLPTGSASWHASKTPASRRCSGMVRVDVLGTDHMVDPPAAFPALLRVLPRRQWRRPGRHAPDRVDRLGRGPHPRPARHPMRTRAAMAVGTRLPPMPRLSMFEMSLRRRGSA